MGVRDARALHDSVVQIVQLTLLVFEMMIARSAGVRWFQTVLEDFSLSTAGGPAVGTALARWEHIRPALRRGR